MVRRWIKIDWSGPWTRTAGWATLMRAERLVYQAGQEPYLTALGRWHLDDEFRPHPWSPPLR